MACYFVQILSILTACLALPINEEGMQEEMETALKVGIIELGSGYSDECIARFQNQATVGFDRGLDALKVKSPNKDVPSLFSLSSEKISLSINSIPASDSTTLVDLYISNEKDSKYQVRLYLYATLKPVNMAIYFVDGLQGCFYS